MIYYAVVRACIPGVFEKETPPEKKAWEGRFSGHEIRQWRVISAAGLQGKGLA